MPTFMLPELPSCIQLNFGPAIDLALRPSHEVVHAMTSLLEVEDLAVCFDGDVAALRGVTFSLDQGESLAVVGETGSGKSTLALCLAGLIQPPEAQESVRIDGQELLGAGRDTLRRLRWATVALALQGSPFNPVAIVGSQVAEPLRERLGMGKAQALARAEELAAEALLDPALLERYPPTLGGRAPNHGPLRRRGHGDRRHPRGHRRTGPSLLVGPGQRLPGDDDHQGPAAHTRPPPRPSLGAPEVPLQPALHAGRGRLR